MPHSSGGGSHSGGSSSFHSSSGGSHSGGRDSGPRISNKPFAGSHRYVYYRNHTPHYYYSSSSTPVEGTSLGYVIAVVIFCLIFILATLPFWSSAIQISRPVSLPEQSEVLIEDYLDVMSDSEELELKKTLEEFRDRTGVVPAVVTNSNSSWINYYTDLETYAYDLYVNAFPDEKHWLIVYTSDNSPEFDNWYFEGMIGDDVSSAISSKAEGVLTDQIYKALVARSRYTVSEAIRTGFISTLEYTSKPRVDSATLLFLCIFCATPSIFIIKVITEYIKGKTTYEKSYSCPDKVTEVQCEYCGQTYVKDIHITCPYCGAHLSHEKVDVEALRRIVKEPKGGILHKIIFTICFMITLCCIFNLTKELAGSLDWFDIITQLIIIPIPLILAISSGCTLLRLFNIKNNGELVTGHITRVNNGSDQTAINVDFDDETYIRYLMKAKAGEYYEVGTDIRFYRYKDKYLLADE